MPEKRMAAVAIAFAVGILAADLVTFVGCLLLVLSLVMLGCLLLPARHRAVLLLIAAVLLSGAARYSADRSIAPDDISRFAGQVRAFEGRVVSDVGNGTNSVRFTFRVDRARCSDGRDGASGDVMINVYPDRTGQMTRFAYGDRARFVVSPYLPSEPENPGQYSYKSYLARHGIYACASIHKPWQAVVLRRGRGRIATALAFAMKRHLVSAIRRIHPPKEATVMCGVVLGTYVYLDDQTLSDFTRTGTMHVLAASGYNCFVLVLIATPLLMLLRAPARYRCVLTIGLIGLYLLMVGPMPSLVRAAIMSALLLVAIPLRRVADYNNLFYVAAIAVLLVNPSDLFDVGFQLSFLAVLALIYVTPVIEAIVSHSNLRGGVSKAGWNRRVGWPTALARKGLAWLTTLMESTAVATIAVGLMTAPIIAYYFNYFSLTLLPANLAVALLVPLVFFDSFASPLTALLPYAPHYAGFVGTAATRAMLWSVNYLGSLRYSSIAVQSPGVAGIVGYYLLLYACACYVRSRLVRK